MTFHLRPAETDTDFAAQRVQRGEMLTWDLAQSAAAGHPLGPDTIAVLYGQSADDLGQHYRQPGAAMTLAWSGGQAVGHLGYARFDAVTAEVEKFFVSDTARGHGIGAALLADVLTRARAHGYHHACLETAMFMGPAIRLYQQCGFVACPPFRTAFDPLSRFLRCDLA
jgi:putative acetyltransferase